MALTNLTKVQTVGIGSNIEVVGVVTTGQFKSGTSNLHSSGVELTNLNVSGIATIGGNLSIGGTLTYQDVTNIDSVGLITARAGVNVSGGQLDVGSNIKLGNAGVITATSFSGSGANLTGIDTDLLSDSSPQLGGDLDTNSHEILLDDDHKIKFGDGADMNIRHTGSYGILENSTGALYLRSSSFIEMRGNNNETFIKATENGAVELFHDNSKKFQTNGAGVDVFQNLYLADNVNLKIGTGADLQIFHNGTDSFIHGTTGTRQLKIRGQEVRVVNEANSEIMAKFIQDGGVELYHNNVKRITTRSGGNAQDGAVIYGNSSNVAVNFFTDTTVRGSVYANSSNQIGFLDETGNWSVNFDRGSNCYLTGHWLPQADNTYDLGNTSYRWRNLYTTDLHLSNKGKTNEVDGTWGDWTLQEGEDKIFMINNRTGKKYSLKMEEE